MFELRNKPHKEKYIGQEMMEFVANAKFEDLPAEVVKRAKHIVMDDIACTLAGRKTRLMYGIQWDHFAEGVSGTVTPIGCDFKTNAATAAFLNACHAQTHDFNDGLNNSGMLGGAYHPGRTVVSVALAVGQQVHASGKDILLAVVMGIEAASRMRNPAHKSTTADCYSAAMTAGKLMGLNAEQLLNACTLAAYIGDVGFFAKPGYGACSANAKNAGHTLNVMQYAYLSRAGVEAANLAKMGFQGGTLCDNNAIASRYATCGLGKEYNVMDMYFKPWPTCRKTHGAIAATLELREKHGVKAEDVKSVKIFQQTTGMYVNTPINTTMDQYGGYFSLQYIVSCAMLDGNVELKHYRWPDRCFPQKYVDFSKKITVVADNGLDGHNAISPNHAIVEVELNDGKILSMYCKYPLGSEPNQMTDAQFEQKLRNCAEEMTTEQQDKLVNWIMTLDTLEAM